MHQERVSLGADFALLAVAAIWGFTFTAVQRALDDAGPISFLAARFAIAALVLAAAFPRRALRINRKGLGFAVLIGLWLTLGYALQTVGLLYTTASRSAFITGTNLIFVPILAVAISRVRLRTTSVLAVPIAAAGMYLLTSPSTGGLNRGDALTFGCALAFALHIATSERAAPHHDPVALAFWQILTALVASGLLLGIAETPRLTLTSWTIAALAVTGVFATALAFTVQMWAQRRTSATHAAVIFAAEPVFAGVFSYVIQHERLALGALFGCALILVSILLTQLGARRHPSVDRERNGTSRS
jgi:drug/metabolite transporter (DMT)-like permease